MLDLKRKIICQPIDYEYLKNRYPNREVIPSVYADDPGWFYLGRKFGKGIFWVRISDTSFWIADEYPMIVRVR